MKTSERHHLKDNELAIALKQANEWAGQHQRPLGLTVLGIVVVGVAIGGYFLWTNRVDAKARTLLAEAMVVHEARVVPPQPPVTGRATKVATAPAPVVAAAWHLSDSAGETRSRAAEVGGRS